MLDKKKLFSVDRPPTRVDSLIQSISRERLYLYLDDRMETSFVLLSQAINKIQERMEGCGWMIEQKGDDGILYEAATPPQGHYVSVRS